MKEKSAREKEIEKLITEQTKFLFGGRFSQKEERLRHLSGSMESSQRARRCPHPKSLATFGRFCYGKVEEESTKAFNRKQRMVVY